MDFLSLHCLPAACLPGRGTFSHTDASVLPSSRLPPWAGVSASSPSSGPLLTLVLPSSTPFADLLWARLRPGASRLPALADAHCRLFRPPRLLPEPSRGPVRGWVLATGTWGGGWGGWAGRSLAHTTCLPDADARGPGFPARGRVLGGHRAAASYELPPRGARGQGLSLSCGLVPRLSNSQLTRPRVDLVFFHRTIPEPNTKPEFWRSHLGQNAKAKRYGGHCPGGFPSNKTLRPSAVETRARTPDRGQRANTLGSADLGHNHSVLLSVGEPQP